MRRTLPITVAAVVLSLLGALAVAVPATSAPQDPRGSRGLFVDPLMKAAQAGPAFSAIGARAQPLWITDYYGSPEGARDATARFVGRAAEVGKTPLLVVYNIPDRDCGLYSSQDDQITDAYYRSWVKQVAAGIGSSKPIVVLEPDAIAFIGDPRCTGRGHRLALLKYATRVLSKAGAWVYIDAGHSGWRTPEYMAPLLVKAGVADARGIATNVANSRTTGAEKAYAAAVVKELGKRRVRGVHYVIDTSRNGAGRNGPENGDVCNPVAARLGVAPRLVFQGAYDGRLWVKLPGESDGPCNGGPSSGEFFPTGACRLLKGPTFYYDESAATCRN